MSREEEKKGKGENNRDILSNGVSQGDKTTEKDFQEKERVTEREIKGQRSSYLHTCSCHAYTSPVQAGVPGLHVIAINSAYSVNLSQGGCFPIASRRVFSP